MARYILGAGAHGREVADIFRSCQQPLDGFLDDDRNLHGTVITGLPVIGDTGLLLGTELSGACEVIVALGKAPLRLSLTERLAQVGHRMISAVHRSAVISPTVSVGLGDCVCAGAVINPDATIRNAVIVGAGATVAHDCVVEDGVHLSPGVHVAGRVRIGRLSFIGTGAAVVPRVRIGAGCIIGAGAVVVDDIPDGVLALGVPARVARVLTEPVDWRRLL